MSPFGKAIAIVLVVVLLFLFPLPYIAKAVNETVDDLVNTHVTEFSNTARKQGTIKKELYEKLIRNLDDTGEIYDVDIEVSHPISGKELVKVELGDEMPELQLDNILYTKKEEDSEEHKLDEIQSFATHTHTDECYSGHRHASSGCTISGDKTRKFVLSSFSYGNGNESVTNHFVKCNTCQNNIVTINYRSSNTGTNTYTTNYVKYRPDGSIVTETYSCWGNFGYNIPQYNAFRDYQGYINSLITYYIGGYGTGGSYSQPVNWTFEPYFPAYTFNPTTNNYDSVSAPYIGCTYCGQATFGQNYSCGLTQDSNVKCNQVVTSITATNPNQIVSQGSAMDTTANATYLNGNVSTVNCTSNFNPNVMGPQTVTLTYTGLVGNAKTNGTRTCTVNVTVKEPYKLTGITVTPEIQDVIRYTSPNFVVMASYDNNTTKQVIGFSVTNFFSNILGTQNVTITYKESDITKSASAIVNVKNLTKVCPKCSTTYYLDDNDSDPGCPNCNSTVVSITASPDYIILHQGEPLEITVEALYLNGKRGIVTGWTSNYDPMQIGIQDVTITYQTFSAEIEVEVINQLATCGVCSLKYELNADGTDPGCPVCSKTVVSIKATPEEVSINKHQVLPITVTATYKDGHTEVVNDWASNLMADTAGVFEVMILYKNVMDVITVTVLEDGQIECPYCGLRYLFNDSPKGCPSCSVTLTAIEASLRSGGIKVPYKSKLNLQITKIFKDEHREKTYTGWTVSNYNPSQLGSQVVTAHFDGFIDELEIEVVDNLPEVTCPNGHIYYLNEDGSDPGCPYCSFTGDKAEALYYFDTTYTNTVMDAIYTQGEYRLEKGDYLKITIRPRNVSILSKILNIFSGAVRKEFTFGGEVS